MTLATQKLAEDLGSLITQQKIDEQVVEKLALEEARKMHNAFHVNHKPIKPESVLYQVATQAIYGCMAKKVTNAAGILYNIRKEMRAANKKK